eukprot:TRINITY_DN1887_c0_g7_i1.p1 TRINITY_DN1887_c0_g7~~TRINITY_DN1887_c0_g7_i1.p1  ORF type:complete len:151 (-),score=33.98 TRINITY_DN1887_c0_g7_i1:36-488(-)
MALTVDQEDPRSDETSCKCRGAGRRAEADRTCSAVVAEVRKLQANQLREDRYLNGNVDLFEFRENCAVHLQDLQNSPTGPGDFEGEDFHCQVYTEGLWNMQVDSLENGAKYNKRQFEQIVECLHPNNSFPNQEAIKEAFINVPAYGVELS